MATSNPQRRVVGLARKLLLATTAAVGACSDAPNGSLVVTHENDLFGFTDRAYTSGSEITWTPEDTPSWARRGADLTPGLDGDGEVFVEYRLAQRIFTPDDLELKDPPEDQRPYAGWLHLGGALVTFDRQGFERLSASIGATGEPSLAEPAQKIIHLIVDSEYPEGWGTQFPAEPTLQFEYRKGWRVPKGEALGLPVDLVPSVAGNLGTVFVTAQAGALVRWGTGLDDPGMFGPPLLALGPSGAGSVPVKRGRPGVGWQVFAGAAARWTGRDMFLDGTLLRDSRSIDKTPLVLDATAGFSLTWRRYRATYAQILRSKSYDDEDEINFFGSLSLAVRL